MANQKKKKKNSVQQKTEGKNQKKYIIMLWVRTGYRDLHGEQSRGPRGR
jgi:hypothetical protein